MTATSNPTIGEGFSSIDLVHQCLLDKDKATAFETALKAVIHPHSSVLELGTGTGILSLIAARAGAGKITAIEFDPYIANLARENIQRNKWERKIEVVTADARSVEFPLETKFDVIIMEMLCTGLIEEMQVQAINNLYSQSLISSDTAMIPFGQEDYISLANTDFMIHGFEMKMVKYLWPHVGFECDFTLLSGEESLNTVHFSNTINENVSKKISFTTNRSGKLNSILMQSRVLIDKEGGITLGSTFSLNPPVIVPLLEERTVIAGETISIEIKYILGGGFQNFQANYI